MWRFKQEIIESIYGQFKEKYLCSDRAIFSGDKLDEILISTQQGNIGQESGITVLLMCISICIFTETCRKVHEGWVPTRLVPPSRLERHEVSR